VVENVPMIAAPEAAAYLPQLVDDIRAAGTRVANAARARAEKAGLQCQAFVVEAAGRPCTTSSCRKRGGARRT
jgi:hypothetical protein